MILSIDGNSLTIRDVVDVARNGTEVELAKGAVEKVQKSRDVVEDAVRQGHVVYGVNTGFGELATVSIGKKDLAKLQVNLLRSHSAGVGIPFSEEVVRGMMLLRANALAKGFSGVRVDVIETLLHMLNKGVHPVVPQQGSVGASGDLAPLAHMALVMIGEGHATYEGESVDGARAMKMAKIKPLTLSAKEGVALINGTQPMTALAALAAHDSLQLVRDAIVASSMSLEALRGT
ncbi:histidine ammonia-lyase, partial [Candidatus Thorarchaeota archaeon]